MYIFTLQWALLIFTLVAVHWKLPDKYKNIWIVLVSALLLIILSPVSFVILLTLTLLYFYMAGSKESISGKQLIILIFCSAGILSFYKLRASVMSTGLDLDPSVESFIIPLGLSYYSFRCIHYAIEKYKHTIPPHGFLEFATYMFYLPTFFLVQFIDSMLFSKIFIERGGIHLNLLQA